MSRWLRWLLSFLPRTAPPGPRLAIVRHHRVYAEGQQPLYRLGVGVATLERQLDLLGALGFTPVTVAEGLAWLRGARDGMRVAFSFDDGYRDNVALAVPALERRGVRATFYLAAGLIESRTAPWWDRLAHRLEHAGGTDLDWTFDGRAVRARLSTRGERRAALELLLPMLRSAPEAQDRRLHELSDRLSVPGEPACELAEWHELTGLEPRGMEVGAHTLTHPFLSLLSPERQDAEIGGSVDLIARRLGVRCRGLAYPGGDYSAASVAACTRHGLAYAVTTLRGDVIPGAAPFELPRRAWTEGGCRGPFGEFSARLAGAELAGAFDGWRRAAEAAS